MSGVSPDQVITDERLDSLERFREEYERKFTEAFPNGDHVGHCRYHLLMIERTEEIRRLRRAIMEKTITGLVFAAIVGVGAAVWFYVVAKVRGG